MRQPSTFPGRAQVADRRLARTIDRLAETWERLDFSVPVATGQRVVVYGSYTFTTYTTGGAAMIGLETADFVSMMPWTDGLGSILFFKWDSVAHEMVITDWAGTELANGTDISDIVSHPYSAALDGSGGAAMTPPFETFTCRRGGDTDRTARARTKPFRLSLTATADTGSRPESRRCAQRP